MQLATGQYFLPIEIYDHVITIRTRPTSPNKTVVEVCPGGGGGGDSSMN